MLRVHVRDPFESLPLATPKDLSCNTVLLLFAGLARIRGDIRAIYPNRVTFTWQATVLKPYAGYLPMVRSTAEGEERYRPIVARDLSAITSDPGDLAPVLC